MRAFSTLLSDVAKFYTDNFKKLFLVSLSSVAIFVAFELFVEYYKKVAGAQLSVTFFLVILMLFMVAAVILGGMALIKTIESPSTAIDDVYAFALDRFGSYCWVAILTTILILLGSILLIIPGIAIAGYVWMSCYVVLFEDVRGMNAVKRSYAYMKGNWFAVFFRFLGFGILFLIGIVCISIFLAVVISPLSMAVWGPATSNDIVSELIGYFVSVFTTPFTIIYVYFIYTDLKKKFNGSASLGSQPATASQSV